jgi:hypothetical protein
MFNYSYMLLLLEFQFQNVSIDKQNNGSRKPEEQD